MAERILVNRRIELYVDFNCGRVSSQIPLIVTDHSKRLEITSLHYEEAYSNRLNDT